MRNWLERAASYPVAIGVIVGMLVSGLAYRITEDTSSSSTVATSANGPGARPDASTPVGSTEEGGAIGAVPGSDATVPSGGGPESGPARPGGGGTLLTASDVGVTPTTIRVGIALEDGATLLALAGTGSVAGPLSVEDQRKTWQAFIDDANRTNAAGGRKIEPFFTTINTASANDQRPACNEWTETDRVFAIFAMGALSTFGGSGTLCAAVEHHTLVIEDTPQTPGDYYAQAGGMLINTYANATRSLADAVYAYEHYGKLRGRKLGLIVDQGQGETMTKQGMIPALKQMGYSLAYTAVVSTDPSQGPAETAPQATQMRAAGVDTVIVATHFINMTAFVTAADRQGWKPQYLVNSYDGNDVALFNTGLPSSFEGATAITYYPFTVSAAHPEDPATRSCRERYNKLTGSSYKPGDLPTTSMRFIAAPCTDIQLLVTAAASVGPAVTRAKVSAAVQSSAFPVRMRGLGGSWRPAKPDFNDDLRAMVWGKPDGSSDNCTGNKDRCWNDAGAAWNPRTQPQ